MEVARIDSAPERDYGPVRKKSRTDSQRPTSLNSSRTRSGVGFCTVWATSAANSSANIRRARLSCLRKASARRGRPVRAAARSAKLGESSPGCSTAFLRTPLLPVEFRTSWTWPVPLTNSSQRVRPNHRRRGIPPKSMKVNTRRWTTTPGKARLWGVEPMSTVLGRPAGGGNAEANDAKRANRGESFDPA